MPKSSIKWTPLLANYPYSEKINSCSIGAETLFTRLLAQSDINGNFYGDLETVTSKLYRCRQEVSTMDIAKWICELDKVGLICFYNIDGSTEKYIHINNVFKVKTKQQISAIYPPGNFINTVPGKNLEKSEKDMEYVEVAGRLIEQINSCFKEIGANDVHFFNSNTNNEYIVARLRDGALEKEMSLIIKHKAATWLRKQESLPWFNPRTMFRPTKYDNNLNAARAWSGQSVGNNYRGKTDGSDYSSIVERGI